MYFIELRVCTLLEHVNMRLVCTRLKQHGYTLFPCGYKMYHTGTLCSLAGTRCTTPVHFVPLQVQDVPHRYKMYHLGFRLQDP